MPDLNALALPEVYVALAADRGMRRLLELARDEDLGAAGDITSAACVAQDATAEGAIVARHDGVCAGLAAVPDLLAAFRSRLEFTQLVEDGERVEAGAVLGRLRGNKREVLAVERTLLNVVGRLCGIATRTRHFVAAVGEGTRARVYDTRKTTPGLRALEKYAVRCGGGRNHRVGLYDAALFKDNHLAGVAVADLPTWVTAAARRAREHGPAFVEVEVDTLEQFEAVLGVEAGLVDVILLDNMPLDLMGRAVDLRDAARPGLELEASGSVTLQTIGAMARTGVERISVGSLTHGAASLDVGLDLIA